MTLIDADGLRGEPDTAGVLYRYAAAPAPLRPQRLRFIPYFTSANRGEGEMQVWIHEI